MALEQLDLPVLCPESTAATEPLSTRRLFHQICGSPIRASRAIRGPAHAPRTYHPKCANYRPTPAAIDTTRDRSPLPRCLWLWCGAHLALRSQRRSQPAKNPVLLKRNTDDQGHSAMKGCSERRACLVNRNFPRVQNVRRRLRSSRPHQGDGTVPGGQKCPSSAPHSQPRTPTCCATPSAPQASPLFSPGPNPTGARATRWKRRLGAFQGDS